MGRPLLLDVWERPVTSLVVSLCTGVWYYLQSKGLGYDDVGMSYAKVGTSCPTPYTLHPTPYIRDPTPYTRDP
jgi:hypothetical protein